MALSRLILILLLLAWGAAWASDDDHGDHDHDDHFQADAHDDHADDDGDHVTRVDGLEILHAWAQATEGDEARIFMEIANEGDADLTIMGGDTDIGGAVTVMAISYSDGGKPVDIGTFPLKAGAEIDLTPDGLFLHVSDLSQHLDQGMSFDMHVDIDPIGEVEIVVEVEAADAATHSHAGHNH
ncbi:MAG: copper chaperone PCu(A)C [Pseudomonadota bacterium]